MNEWHDPSARWVSRHARGLKKAWPLEAFGLYGLRDAGTLLDVVGLMVNARIDRRVWRVDPKEAAQRALFDVSSDLRLNHEFAVSLEC